MSKPVDVSLAVLGRVVVEQINWTLHIQPTCRFSGGNDEVTGARLKLLNGSLAVHLGHAIVQGQASVAHLQQGARLRVSSTFQETALYRTKGSHSVGLWALSLICKQGKREPVGSYGKTL